MPSDWLPQAQARLDETTECRTLIAAKGSLPLGGVSDIRPLLKSAEIGATLEPHGLLGRAERRRRLPLAQAFPAKAGPGLPDHGRPGERPGAVPLARIRDQRQHRHQRPSAGWGLAGTRPHPQPAQGVFGAYDGPAERHPQLHADHAARPRHRPARRPVLRPRQGRPPGARSAASSTTRRASGATLFMEPQVVVDLGNEIKELTIKEEQEVQRILRRLTESVARVSDRPAGDNRDIGRD